MDARLLPDSGLKVFERKVGGATQGLTQSTWLATSSMR